MHIRRIAKLVAINAAVAALLAAIGLAGLEAYLRFTIPGSSPESIFEYTLATKRYKVMKANTQITSWGKELRTNDLGFRDRAATVPAKRPGEFRIVVLGDSMTVSAGVDIDHIYTSLIQDRLRQQYPQATVINLAVGGYNIVQYRMVLDEIGLALEPDLIVASVFPENDFNNDTYDTNYRVAAGREPAVPAQPWHETLYVYRAYLGKLEGMIRSRLPGRPQAPPGPDTSGWDDNTAALQAIADTGRARKVPVAVALLPSTWNFARQRELFGRVLDHCSTRGIACIDLLTPFAASGVHYAALRLNALDAHPNERYNVLVAEHLTPYLEPYVARALADRLPRGKFTRTGG
jgi:hypothetical protein